MVVTVMIRENAARALQSPAPSTSESRAVLDAARELGVALTPVHPGSQDPALVGVFRVDVPDLATAERVVTRLRQIPAVESAYLKPADELP